MPVIEEVLLSDLIGMDKHAHEQVAWSKERMILMVATAT